MKNKLIATLFLLTAATANSKNLHYGDINYYEINKKYFIGYYDNDNCVSEYIVKLDEAEKVSRACFQDKALQLTWKDQNYPNLNMNPRRVQYWVGSFSKTVTGYTTYLRELVDDCHGRILSKTTFTEKSKKQLTFDIRNPNLDPSIKESFMLSPMTQSEAEEELIQTKKRCTEELTPHL